MKKALKVSVLLNVVLASCVLLLRHNSTSSTAALRNFTKNSFAKAISEPHSATTSGRPFNWSELESGDYPTYIANLRRIGCPEATVRDIIKADVGELYESRRRNLETNAEVSRPLQQLREEEDWVLATLLGAPAPADFSQASNIPPRSGRPHAQEQTASLPLVFQNVDLSELKLNRDQLQAIEDLRQKFINDFGGPEQNPADPAYGDRWLKSRAQIDNDLRGFIGVKAFQDYQNLAESVAEGHERAH